MKKPAFCPLCGSPLADVRRGRFRWEARCRRCGRLVLDVVEYCDFKKG